MTTLLIATRNAHKVEEIRTILGEGFRCLTLDDFDTAPEVVEDAGTFAGNATKKSVELAKWLSALTEVDGPARRNPVTFALADDSGLEVDALGGEPGVHSARYAASEAGGHRNSSVADNNAKLLQKMKDIPTGSRAARFRCVIALTPVLEQRGGNASPVCNADEFEGQTELFEGKCEGRIEFEARGEGGFGYDPLFVPAGFDKTFGELSAAVKNGLSHRAKALAKLKTWLKAEQRVA